jgi:hypothetical protein
MKKLSFDWNINQISDLRKDIKIISTIDYQKLVCYAIHKHQWRIIKLIFIEFNVSWLQQHSIESHSFDFLFNTNLQLMVCFIFPFEFVSIRASYSFFNFIYICTTSPNSIKNHQMIIHASVFSIVWTIIRKTFRQFEIGFKLWSYIYLKKTILSKLNIEFFIILKYFWSDFTPSTSILKSSIILSFWP